MKLVLLFLIINIGSCFSQNNSGIVTYKVTSSKLSDTITNKKAKELFLMISKNFESLEYELSFNGNESLFYIKDGLESDNKIASGFMKQAILVACDDIIYTNSNLKLNIIKEELLGDVFLIKDSLVNDWKISSDTKIINGYTCLKASKILDKNKIRVKNEVVVAWFAKDIPVSFGPKGNFGLPGLILEVEHNNVIFYAKNINFDKKVEIQKPTDGIEMTYIEYQDYIDKKIKEYGFEKN
ncbi:GLPGLI family protein [Psychroserpens damuponensis]|uniref:GLPGLI family protein n=1 Tax=Psychroserpens damuponensis TaxID=943936 RepID=UPI00058B4F28|nr:GLPGLI family protein [Psychroserpens damuponensis]